MLTKKDCLMLLSEIEDTGVDTQEQVTKLLKNNSIDLDVLKFINEHRQIDVTNFYEKLRKNYNDKKSKIYKEIVQIDEKEPKDVLITLSSLLTQILLFSKSVSDRQLFLSHSRADEITAVLNNYFKTFDTTICISLLYLIRADIKVFSEISK